MTAKNTTWRIRPRRRGAEKGPHNGGRRAGRSKERTSFCFSFRLRLRFSPQRFRPISSSSLLAVLFPRLAFPLRPPIPLFSSAHSPAHSMTWSPEGVLRVTLYARALTAPARAGRRAAVEGLAATRAPEMREVERRASDIFDSERKERKGRELLNERGAAGCRIKASCDERREKRRRKGEFRRLLLREPPTSRFTTTFSSIFFSSPPPPPPSINQASSLFKCPPSSAPSRPAPPSRRAPAARARAASSPPPPRPAASSPPAAAPSRAARTAG